MSFHLIISDPTASVLGQELPALVQDGYTSFKVFMTYEGLALADRELLEVFACARETGTMAMVHAENYDERNSHNDADARQRAGLDYLFPNS